MDASQKLSSELQNIKQIMERSSRFISLSGLSGISAGICALVGAWFANEAIKGYGLSAASLPQSPASNGDTLAHIYSLYSGLFQIAFITFIAAFIAAFIFTYRRSAKANVPIWGTTARRLLINVAVPMIAGGIFLIALIQHEIFGFIVPACLVFYGLGVLNASKYTLTETKYLGYSEIILGLISLWFTSQSVYFWAAGFGALHIIYGIFMWWKYERN